MIEGCKLCVSNAEKHYKSAIALGIIKEYGIGNSHLILACEESIKAFVIYSKFVMDDERDISDFFSDHKEKHELAKSGYSIFKHEAIESKRMRDELTEYLKEHSGEDEEKVKELAQFLLSKRKEEKIMNETNETKRKEKEWWEQQNQRKNIGFYVDFDGKRWISPNKITKQMFLESKERVNHILDVVYSCKDISMEVYKSKKQ